MEELVETVIPRDELTEEIPSPNTDIDATFNLDSFIDNMRDVNNEVLQVEEIQSQTEKMKWDVICYLKNLLTEYNIHLKIPAKAVSDVKGLLALHLDKTGILTYHFKDGGIKSYEMQTYAPSHMLNILKMILPTLKSALRTKRKEFEGVSNILSKVQKQILILQNESTT